jgi:hypothetical protein
VAEGAEDLPGGHVEGDVEELGHAVAGPDAEVSGLGEEEVADVGVGDGDAVGRARRARGEQHVAALALPRVRVRVRWGGEAGLVPFGRRGRRGVDGQDGDPGGGRDAVGVAGVGEDHARPGGGEDVAQLRGGGDADVLRHVRRARLEGGEQPGQHRDRAAGEEGDVVAGADAEPGEAGREAVGLPVEFAVGDGLAEVFGGGSVRAGRGVPLEGVVDVGVGDRPAGSRSEELEEPAVALAEVAQEGVPRC